MKAKDLIGQRFGKLTVVARGENTKGGKTTWVCACDCGKQKEKPVTSYDLTSGKVRSCGCLYYESNKGINATHHGTGTRLYRIWNGMRQRCNYQKGIAYDRYGGKGISVCKEWDDFEIFRTWSMANGYAENLTIDRIDNSKGYSPENCRWATMKEQIDNRSNTVRITIGGVEKTLSEWSEISGIPAATLWWRVKNHWAEDELLMPVSLSNAKYRKERKVC